MSALKTAQITLEYQNYIQTPPVAPKQLYSTAASNDGVTIDAWRHIWVKNTTENKKKFGSFAEQGLGKLHNIFKYRPVIIAGSGPSLARNGAELKDKSPDMPLISCLHNFHFFEDRGVKVDFYVTLDAGEVTIEEVSEGGAKTADEYWALTKDRTLIAYTGTSPRLLEKWQGKIYFFSCPLPSLELETAMDQIEPFRTTVSPGGNVLGGCLYIAKAIMGAAVIAFVGADLAFGYDKKFHGWDSKYDANLGHVLRSVDVFGNRVLTWQSYHGFKCFFDWVSQTVPGIYFNCSEGGTLGAYPEGNIMSIQQSYLSDFLRMFELSEELKEQCVSPGTAARKTLY